MKSKKWIKIWIIIMAIIPTVGGFNYLIDPLNINKNNLINLKKITQTTRSKKIMYIRSIENVDNLILGSSRTMRLDPNYVSKFLNGDTFNFSVNSARPEDYLGILLFLEKIKKIPKRVIIGWDFYTFNETNKHDSRFLSNKELNFTEIGVENNYFSLKTIKKSFQTIYHNIAGSKEKSKYNVVNGFLSWQKKDDLINNGEYNHLEKIRNKSAGIFLENYSVGRYAKFSNERILYLENIKSFAKKHNIKLYTFLTPAHCHHLSKIKNHKILNKTLTKFKSFLSTKFNYTDFMIQNDINCKDSNYYDATHPIYPVGKLIVNDLFTTPTIFGKRVDISKAN